jgi:rare lipoprotein A
MNQNRWTCLATVILTTVIGPIANVQANTLSSASVNSGDSYIPVSPQSLPTITPLVVTELETDLVVPVKLQPVPLVSKLPIVRPYRQTTGQARSKYPQLAKSNRRKHPLAKLPVITPIFSTNTRVTQSFPIATIASPVIPLPARMVVPTTKPQVLINPTNTATTIKTKVDSIPVDSLPQVSAITSSPKDRFDAPVFASGTPVFGINNEQTPQIVNTVIAQVGNTIVAPEPSIAIPVETPKQSTTPTKLPVLTTPVSTIPTSIKPTPIKPTLTTPSSITPIVKIEQPAATIKPALDKIVATQSGQASWYGIEGGPETASGERYNPNGLTAAHRTLPFGTKVRVTSIKTGKVVTVRINDRGPFHSRRIIDVSAGAAEVIGIKDDGIGDVRLEVLGREG